jgi:hypothetical protein
MIPVEVFTSAAASSLFFLAKTIPFMVIGVIFAELIVALRVVDKIAFVARPITNFAHLRDECGASFITAFVSAMSANAARRCRHNLLWHVNTRRVDKDSAYNDSGQDSVGKER